jgi:hypothetical protein
LTSIVEALRDYVLADSTISGLIGSRMYAAILPQHPTMPAITYQIISGDSVISHDGSSGLENPTIQIDCWADTYSQMDALFNAVRKRLNVASGTFLGVEVQGVFLLRKRDLYDDEAKLYRRTADYDVWNSESVS